MAKRAEPQVQSIEEKLKRLEEISNLLDRGALPLEQQLVLFEEGVTVAKECREYIEQAQTKVVTLGQNLQNQADEA